MYIVKVYTDTVKKKWDTIADTDYWVTGIERLTFDTFDI